MPTPSGAMLGTSLALPGLLLLGLAPSLASASSGTCADGTIKEDFCQAQITVNMPIAFILIDRAETSVTDCGGSDP